MLFVQGEVRKVIEFKSKKGNSLYKLKVELERYDLEIFVLPTLYKDIEEIKNCVGSKMNLPVFLNTDISEDKTKVYRNFVLFEMPTKA